MRFGIWELLIILVIVLLIFGPKRLKGLGADLGAAIKGFRTAVKDDNAPKEEERLIEGELDESKAATGSQQREQQQDRQ